MIKIFFLHVSLFFCLFCLGCSDRTNTVTQTSTIDALLAGHYDGDMTCGELLEYGNFGIGTFDRLEGEMAVIDGKVYQIKADGKVYRPNTNITTPFASVCMFQADDSIEVKSQCDFAGLENVIGRAVGSDNIFCAIRIDGEFSYMKTRSVPAQTKPYPELAEVTKSQAVFEMNDIAGTIVGFRCPEFVKGVNVPGCHLHFLSDDRSKGGHILECRMESGTINIDRCNKFMLLLPEDSDLFAELDLTKDRTEQLKAAEK